MNRVLVAFTLILAGPSAQAGEIERLQYDLDRDGRMDSIRLSIPENWSDPGEFTQLEVHLGKGKKVLFEESAGWVSYAHSADEKLAQWFDTNNLLPSHRVVLLSDGTSNYLFLFGYAYASSPGELVVIRFQDSGASSIFKSEFWPVKIENGPGPMRLIGQRCFSQGWGKNYNCSTYAPFNVLTLGAAASLDATRTKEFNLKNYYGYVGPECSEASAVVEQAGRRVVVGPEAANEICSK